MIFRLKRSILELFNLPETTDRTPRTISKATIMKHIILTATTFIGLTSAAFAGSGVGGIGFMDDLITPYDDTKIELPGEDTKKPSVSRSARLVDDSTTDTWGTRDNGSSAPGKKPRQF